MIVHIRILGEHAAISTREGGVLMHADAKVVRRRLANDMHGFFHASINAHDGALEIGERATGWSRARRTSTPTRPAAPASRVMTGAASIAASP